MVEEGEEARMCPHINAKAIEEGVKEEFWEGDFYVENLWDWFYCPDCDDDFACKAA